MRFRGQRFSFIPAWFLLLLVFAASNQTAVARIRQETLAAFDRYVQLTEQRIGQEVGDPRVFLYVNTLRGDERRQVLESLRRGEVYMTPLVTRDASGHEIAVPDGMIHHWLGAVLIPRASLQDVLRVVQDYDHKQDVYPEVVQSHLISRDGEHFRAMMRFREHHVITVTLDTEHDIVYTEADPRHWYSRSFSTRVAQVEDAGRPGEHDLPEGEGDGFIWRINSYWRFVEQDGGTYLEVEAVSLSRAIPAGIGWMIRPYITSVPRKSLEDTLICTRSTVLGKLSGGRRPDTGQRTNE